MLLVLDISYLRSVVISFVLATNKRFSLGGHSIFQMPRVGGRVCDIYKLLGYLRILENTE